MYFKNFLICKYNFKLKFISFKNSISELEKVCITKSNLFPQKSEKTCLKKFLNIFLSK